MPILSAFLFALSANIDSFIVGMSYGIRKSHLPILTGAVISLITFSGTVLALLLGTALSSLFPGKTTEWLGCLLLFGLGGYYIGKAMIPFILKNFKKRKGNRKQVVAREIITTELHAGTEDTFSSTLHALKDGLLPGLALSANNFGMGIGASITGLKILPTALLSLLLSVGFLFLGSAAGGKYFRHISGQTADLLSGLLLVGLGFLLMF